VRFASAGRAPGVRRTLTFLGVNGRRYGCALDSLVVSTTDLPADRDDIAHVHEPPRLKLARELSDNVEPPRVAIERPDERRLDIGPPSSLVSDVSRRIILMQRETSWITIGPFDPIARRNVVQCFTLWLAASLSGAVGRRFESCRARQPAVGRLRPGRILSISDAAFGCILGGESCVAQVSQEGPACDSLLTTRTGSRRRTRRARSSNARFAC